MIEIVNHLSKHWSYGDYGFGTNPLDEAKRIYHERGLNCSDRKMSDDNTLFMKIFHDMVERRKRYYL